MTSIRVVCDGSAIPSSQRGYEPTHDQVIVYTLVDELTPYTGPEDQMVEGPPGTVTHIQHDRNPYRELRVYPEQDDRLPENGFKMTLACSSCPPGTGWQVEMGRLYKEYFLKLTHAGRQEIELSWLRQYDSSRPAHK